MASFQFHAHLNHLLLKILLLTFVTKPSFSVTPDDPTSQLIIKICDQTLDKQFCINVLQQNLPSPSTDAQTFAKISINQVLANVTNTLSAVRQAKASASKEVADLLTICEEGYTVVSSSFNDALQALAINDSASVFLDEEQSERPIKDCANNINSVLPQFEKYNAQNLALQKISAAAASIYFQQPPRS
ncbi:cell wall / vacuolar inhibitor of fructosidase 2-like [Coffea eugenioides]|uniref:cell wall / vacuolar inhibitor of fructosidase 2-like n=1 Tax=Coffea eugenioides TaxID=49369 RepID=UPI000F606F5D|nr:cell wall / vacuolar inhibitor of fructosidase 2-like [Coffea eugenioides]